VCNGGACGVLCDSGLTNCGGSCVNTSNDTMNCGGCGKTCAVCLLGLCL
jgi:hypothetical protein